ncbi:unnamed protein product [Rodentolepis nana]|uniref:Uncharacterized protein n=1 Tax=Rodentolepis nana TaxID=102285 RepID=A0A0R3TUU5_RODNA|nr:unnamed protein product [Rodentolepis nana]
MTDAMTKWPDRMYVESISEAAKQIEANNKLILVCSRMEAERILSEECRLSKVNLLELLLLFLLILLFMAVGKHPRRSRQPKNIGKEKFLVNLKQSQNGWGI